MNGSDSLRSPKRRIRTRKARPERCRRDGWTAERQLRFLQVLAATHSVTRAAASVRMSRESAYRLRSRLKGGLFALAWDSVYAPRLTSVVRSDVDKSHISLSATRPASRGPVH
jgi:hypothetical protein